MVSKGAGPATGSVCPQGLTPAGQSPRLPSGAAGGGSSPKAERPFQAAEQIVPNGPGVPSSRARPLRRAAARSALAPGRLSPGRSLGHSRCSSKTALRAESRRGLSVSLSSCDLECSYLVQRVYSGGDRLRSVSLQPCVSCVTWASHQASLCRTPPPQGTDDHSLAMITSPPLPLLYPTPRHSSRPHPSTRSPVSLLQADYRLCNGSDKECVSPTAKVTKKETLKVGVGLERGMGVSPVRRMGTMVSEATAPSSPKGGGQTTPWPPPCPPRPLPSLSPPSSSSPVPRPRAGLRRAGVAGGGQPSVSSPDPPTGHPRPGAEGELPAGEEASLEAAVQCPDGPQRCHHGRQPEGGETGHTRGPGIGLVEGRCDVTSHSETV